MRKGNFVENSDTAFAQQLNTHAASLPGFVSTLGLTVADTTQATNDAAYFAYFVAFIDRAHTYSRDATSTKDIARRGPVGSPTPPFPPVLDPGSGPSIVPPGIEQRFRDRAKRIKAAPNYTDSIGQALAIVGPTNVDPLVPKPVLKATATSNSHVLLKYVKKHQVGVYIEMQRNEIMVWARVGTVTKSSFIDTTPPLNPALAESRRYRAIFFKSNGDTVGDYSDVVFVSTVL